MFKAFGQYNLFIALEAFECPVANSLNALRNERIITCQQQCIVLGPDQGIAVFT